jgi:transcriptional regulator with PAS, ATPase and Fis domain
MMIGQSPSMQELRARIGRVAGTHFTVLIEGESGAGKELVAREIHTTSARRNGPFVPVNCAALVESLLEAELFGIEERAATGVKGRRGKFELADHGTLFLDEIADLSPAAQAKLLRVLQDFSVERVGGQMAHRVDTRVVAATNRDLRAMVQTGQFRADLYYRISGVEVVVPPLRDRRQDVPLLVEFFAGRHRRIRQLPFEASALSALVAHDWPGNVRQLSRVIERALALAPGPSIRLDDLPPDVTKLYDETGVSEEDQTLRGCISRYARRVLDRCDGNKRRACDILDISYHTLQAYLDYDGAATPGTVPDVPPAAGALVLAPAALCEKAS